MVISCPFKSEHFIFKPVLSIHFKYAPKTKYKVNKATTTTKNGCIFGSKFDFYQEI